jgi:hypothetical protein
MAAAPTPAPFMKSLRDIRLGPFLMVLMIVSPVLMNWVTSA